MRAVSFFGEGAGAIDVGATARAAAAAGIAGAGAFDGGTNGGGVNGCDGAGGMSGFAIGGRTAPPFGVVKGTGGDALGGRAGKLMRTVSRFGAAAAFPSAGRVGNVMRTVSFFGSFASAMTVREKLA